MTTGEQSLMERAVALARNSLFLSDPNPRVGCVIARDGNVLAEGWTQPAGQAHAEIHALSQAGEAARGADVYVTLEPCSHTGRTGPCTEALVAAGVKRVFAATGDPNPLVAGQGFERLRGAGIEVHVGLCEAAARAVNRGFLRRVAGGRPWVRLKLGATLDGRTAAADGASRWITGEGARADVQRWRARSSAVVTGIGTVLADDPSMNVRLDGAAVQPLRVILDSHGRIAAGARILSVPGRTLVVTTGAAPAGAGECVALASEDGRVGIEPLLTLLAGRDCNEILVEAGPTLSGAFAASGLVDEYVIYLAPSILGDAGRGMFRLGRHLALAESLKLEFTDVTMIDRDIRILARPVQG